MDNAAPKGSKLGGGTSPQRTQSGPKAPFVLTRDVLHEPQKQGMHAGCIHAVPQLSPHMAEAGTCGASHANVAFCLLACLQAGAHQNLLGETKPTLK